MKGVTPPSDLDPLDTRNRAERRARPALPQPPKEKSPMEEQMELVFEMMPVLPHSLNVILNDQAGAGWATLSQEHLVGSSSDLILKHGSIVPGRWHMLGILDAQPDQGGQADMEANSAINFADPARLGKSSWVGLMAGIMSPLVRVLLGRSGAHFGVTPLLIFRQVGHAGI